MKEEKTKKEKRAAGVRVAVNLLVKYQEDGNYLFDFSKNLGQGGVFIQTKKPKAPGSLLELTFTTPDSQKSIKTKGEVIWAQKPVKGRQDLVAGMGIQFQSFDSEDHLKLQDMIKEYAK